MEDKTPVVRPDSLKGADGYLRIRERLKSVRGGRIAMREDND
jgi:hypothetical protein